MTHMSLGESLRAIEAEIAAGRAESALAQCQDAQAQYPRALSVQRVLGETYLSLRKPREALAALERVLAGDPEDARALCARALVYQMHGDAQAALQWYRRACDVRPEDQVLRSTYSELAGRLGQPAYQPTRVGLARLYLRNDLYAHALREWESLAQETPDLLEVQVGLAETLWRVERGDEAQALCERILTNAPTCLKALLLLAATHYDAGRDEEALRLALRARDLDPELRIGHALFSDRLAAGDLGLRALLNGEKTERAQRSRPLANSRPLAAAQSGRDVSQIAAHVAARPLSSLDLGVKVPEEFQGLFSETEFMLWGPDDETRTRMATQALEATDKYPRVKPPPKHTLPIPPEPPPPSPKVTARPVPETPPVAPAPPTPPAPAQEFVPPALIEHGIPLQDDEARDAIGWVNWLQSQGAQAQGTPSQGAPVSPPQRAATNAPGANGATDDPGRTARTAPPLAGASALRAMFAELGPTPHGGESETERLARVKELAQQPDAARPDGVTGLEALEAELASSGFQRMEAGQGMLASIAAGEAAARALGVDPNAPPSDPANDDYSARLRQARECRKAGKLDEAFAAYRVLLKLAPDLLPDVAAEVEEALRVAPDHPEARRLLGDVKLKQGDYMGALEAYNRAVELAQARG
jgi:tetratricopeptide (TPR) repeat protein